MINENSLLLIFFMLFEFINFHVIGKKSFRAFIPKINFYNIGGDNIIRNLNFCAEPEVLTGCFR